MKNRLHSKYLLEALESRLMFSADIALAPVDGGAVTAGADDVLEVTLAPGSADSFEQAEDVLSKEIVFIDAGVDDYQQLLDDLSNDSNSARQFETVVLDAYHDGITQITSYLAQQQDISAIHILSHGSAGEVVLGSTALNLTTLDTYAGSIESWQQALTDEADLFFYGCNLASGAEGQTLVDSIALLTGADVAASDDLTGNARSGGDWVLEYGQGEIETAVAFSAEAQQGWLGTLARPEILATETPLTLQTIATDANQPLPAGPVGTLVSDIVDLEHIAGGLDNVLDPDSPDTGIAITQINSDAGQLHYTIDGGASWNQVSPLAGPNNALLLTADPLTRVYFQPLDNFTGYIDNAFNFRAWDATGFANGTSGVSTTGPSDIFSTGQKNISQQVTLDGTNTAPTASNLNLNELYAVDTPLNLVDIVITDVDSGKVGVTINLSDTLAGSLNTPSVGSGQDATRSTFVSGKWNVVGSTADVNTILKNLVFTPAAGYSAPVTLDISVSDGIAAPLTGAKVLSTTAINLPVGGFTNPNVIPATEISQSTFGDGVISINWKAIDADPATFVTLNNFEYSDNGGTDWYAIDTLSGAFSPNWNDNGGSGYAAAASFLAAPTHSFTFNTKHADVTAARALDNIDQSDIRIRFFVNDGTANSSSPTVSAPFRVDNQGPVVTVDGWTFSNPTKTISLTGSGMLSIAPAATEILSLLNELGMQINSSTPVTFLPGDVLSADLVSDGQILLNLTNAKASEINGIIAENPTLFIPTDFTKDTFGNPGTLTTAGNITSTPNTAPVANDDGSAVLRIFTAEETPVVVDVLANDSDADGTLDPTTVTVAPATNGTLSVSPANGFVTYTPNGDFVGTDSFTYTVRDNSGAISNVATVYLNVTALNDAPVAVDDGNVVVPLTTPEDTPLLIDVVANDTDVDSLIDPSTVAIVTPAANGSLSVNPVTGFVTYTPNKDFVGTDSFTYTVRDEEGALSNEATVYLDITPVNDPVELENATLVISKGQTTTVTSSMIEAEDVDTAPTALTFTVTNVNGGQFELASAPGSGIAGFTQQQIDDGDIVFVDDGDDIAPTFDIEVTDGEFTDGPVAAEVVFVRDVVWLSTTSDVTGSGVTGLSDWTNKDFLQMGDPGFGLEPGVTNGTFSKFFSLQNFTSDTDVRLTSLHAVTSQIVIGETDTVTLEPGDILFTLNGGKPTLGGVTVDKVDVVRFRPDTAGDYGTGTFEIVLDAPISPPLGQDLGGVSLVEKDTWIGDFEVEAGNFLLVETKGNEQVIHYYEVLDAGEGTTSGGTLTTLVDGSDLNIGTAEIMSIHLVSDDLDIGGAILSSGEILLSLDRDKVGADLFAGIEVETNEVVALDFLTVTAGATSTSTVSSARIIFEGTDASFAETIDSFSLTSVSPSPFNASPNANDDGSAATPLNTPEDTPLIIDVTANDTDLDGSIDPTTVAVGSATNGTLSVNPVTGAVTYSPNLNFAGTDSFTYTVRDDQGAISNSATVYINVTPVNDAPEGGYTVANTVLADPATDGSGLVTITWKATDVELENVTLHSFAYSTDGSSWQTPSSGDTSLALSSGWNSSKASFADFPSALDYSFTFDTQHPDVSLDDNTWPTVYVRFVLNDGTNDSAPVISEAFLVDNEHPTPTITDATYFFGSLPTNEGVLEFDGTDYLTVADAGTDVKDYLNWNNLTFVVVNGATTTDVTFTLADITSAVVTSDTVFTITLTDVKTAAMEGTPGFGNPGGGDGLAVTAGFFRDAYGNAATTDGTVLTPPTAINATESWTEDNVYQFSNAILTADPDGDSVTVTLTLSDPLAGTLNAGVFGTATSTYTAATGVWQASGDVTDVNELLKALEFSPATNYDSDFTIATSVEDGVFAPQIGTITMTAVPVGDTPTVDNIVTLEDTPSGLIYISPHAEDGPEVTHFRISNITNGTLFQADGTTPILDGEYITLAEATAGVIFKPSANSNLTGTFDVESSEDGANVAAQSGVATANIDVTPVNDPTVVTGGTSGSGAEDGGAITGTLTATDDDGLSDGTVFTVTGAASNGVASIDPGTGAWSYTPNADYNGIDSFTVTITDDDGNAVTQDVSITVNAVADIVADTETTDEDTAVTTNVLANDSFEGTPIITAVTPGANGTVAIVDANLGTVSYTPNPNFHGSDSYSYTVTSGGVTETVNVDVTITQVDDPVTIGGDLSGSGAEDGGAITGTLTATDLADGLTDGSYFTIELGDEASNGSASINPSSGLWSYTPNADYNGPDSFTVTITDDDGNTATRLISITVNAVTDIVADTETTDEDTAVTTDVLANDTFEGTPTITSVTQGSNGTVAIVDANLGTVSYTPDPNFHGSDSYSYTVTSGGVTETVTVDVTVDPVNDPTVVTGGTGGSGAEDGGAITGTLAVTDADGLSDGTVFTVTGAASNGVASIDPGTGAWSYTPNADYYGPDSFTVTITDDDGNAVTQDISITVNAVADIVADTETTDEDTAVTSNVLANDTFEGTPLITAVTQGANGTVAIVDANLGTVRYTPDPNFHGSDSYSYTVTSGGLTETVTVTVTIDPVNDLPVANNDTLRATEDNDLTIVPATALLDNDTDPDFDNLVLQSFGQPANGTLSIDVSTGSLLYQPASNYFGNDSFTYTISDGMGGSADGVALIIVAPVGDTPQVADATVTAGVMSDPIIISSHASDGAEVTHFRISGITGGVLYLADGTTEISEGDYITVVQGQAGVLFLSSGTNGGFQVESSQDGVSVAAQSGKASSTIMVLAPPEPPVTEPGDPPGTEEGGEETDPVDEPTDEPEAPAESVSPDDEPVSVTQDTNTTPDIELRTTSPDNERLTDVDDFRTVEEGKSTSHTLRVQLTSKLFDAFKNAIDDLDVSTLSHEAYELVRNSLDDFKEEFKNDMRLEQVLVGSAAVSTIGLSAGYVVWMLKGGSLLASVLSSIPAWQLADPLSILAGSRDDEEDEETLETIIEGKADDDDTSDQSEDKD